MRIQWDYFGIRETLSHTVLPLPNNKQVVWRKVVNLLQLAPRKLLSTFSQRCLWNEMLHPPVCYPTSNCRLNISLVISFTDLSKLDLRTAIINTLERGKTMKHRNASKMVCLNLELYIAVLEMVLFVLFLFFWILCVCVHMFVLFLVDNNSQVRFNGFHCQRERREADS